MEKPTPEQIIKKLSTLDATERQLVLDNMPLENQHAVRKIWADRVKRQSPAELSKLSDKDFQTIFGRRGDEIKELVKSSALRNDFASLFENGQYSLDSLNSMLETALTKKAPQSAIEDIFKAMQPGLTKDQSRARRAIIDYARDQEPYIRNNKIWTALRQGGLDGVAETIKTPEDVARLKAIMESSPKLAGGFEKIAEKRLETLYKEKLQKALTQSGELKGGVNISELNDNLKEAMPMIKALAPSEAFYKNISDYQKFLESNKKVFDRFLNLIEDTKLKSKWAPKNFFTVKNIMTTVISPTAGAILGGMDRLKYSYRYKKLTTDPYYAIKQLSKLRDDAKDAWDTIFSIPEITKDISKSAGKEIRKGLRRPATFSILSEER